ncbi:MAG: Txe/YoeB family addiction module toxin [Spirochaetaceae bacterium]|nr:Txe/YoeB family addiction module toxin [Spirochaetaceae bacterium]
MSKRIIFQSLAWEDYHFWQIQDRKTLKRINQLIKDIEKHNNEGSGKREPLKHKPGYWNRRIDSFNRLVYRLVNDTIEIAQCRSHYDD